ncbi:MAG TPA: hypothetical protein VFY14_16055 [Streptomyces sp.]|nr:hypothetical protein [Streptomyces sp.]
MPEPKDQHDDTPAPRRAPARRDQRERWASQARQEPRERARNRAAPVDPADPGESGSDAERRRRRALFLRELHEAKALRERVQPRRARAARMRQAMRMRTFRW